MVRKTRSAKIPLELIDEAKKRNMSVPAYLTMVNIEYKKNEEIKNEIVRSLKNAKKFKLI